VNRNQFTRSQRTAIASERSIGQLVDFIEIFIAYCIQVLSAAKQIERNF
jgi:hypothetical protein